MATSRVWLITGTSSGFGRRLVTSVLARGDRVIATARCLEKLEVLTASCDVSTRENLRIIQLDITEGGESIKAKVDQAAAIWGRIDVLVNNAGFGYAGLIEEQGVARLREQFETNVFGVMEVTLAALPHLRAKKDIDSTVIVVGSRSAWRSGIPGSGIYSASKAAVHVLTDTLTVELAPFNIRVLLVAPGSFRTEGIYRHDYYSENPIPAYDELRAVNRKMMTSRAGSEKGDPDKAMQAVVDVVRGEGFAEGKPWPGYLFLGEDAYLDVKEKCVKTLKVLEDWKEITNGVGFDTNQ